MSLRACEAVSLCACASVRLCVCASVSACRCLGLGVCGSAVMAKYRQMLPRRGNGNGGGDGDGDIAGEGGGYHTAVGLLAHGFGVMF